MTRKSTNTLATLASGVVILIISMGTAALAQMNNRPFGFQPRNGASIAALMQQVENQNSRSNGNGGVAAFESNTTTLVCGSDGASSAQGNSSCVILNNANADLQMGQEAQGEQSASAETNSSIDSVMETLETEDITDASQ